MLKLLLLCYLPVVEIEPTYDFIHKHFFEPGVQLDFLHRYNHILADMSFGLLQVFHVKLRSQHRTCNGTLYLIPMDILIPITMTIYHG